MTGVTVGDITGKVVDTDPRVGDIVLSFLDRESSLVEVHSAEGENRDLEDGGGFENVTVVRTRVGHLLKSQYSNYGEGKVMRTASRSPRS